MTASQPVIFFNPATKGSLKALLSVTTLCWTFGPIPNSDAAQTNAIWKGGVSTYASALNWDIGILPNNGVTTYHVIIDQNPGTSSSISLNTSPTIDSLAIESGDTFVIENARILRVVGTSVTNAGTLAVRSAGSVTILRLDNSMTLSGGGTLSLLAENLAEILSTAANTSLTNQDNVIRGQGRLGLNSMQIVNQFTVRADSPGRVLDIDPNTNGLLNTGLLLATNSGILQCSNGDYDNDTGMIRTIDNSEIRLSDATVQGGTLVVEPGSTLSVRGSSTLQNIDLQMKGLFDIPFATTAQMLGQPYTQTNGTTVVDGDLDVSAHGYDLFDGSLQGRGTVFGSVTNQGGNVGPGSPIGKLTISGDYVQNLDGTLNITLDGTSQGISHDILHVQGAAVLNGTLEMDLEPGFLPRDEDSFVILEATSLSGTFGTVKTRVDPDQSFSITYTNHQVIAHFSQTEDNDNDGVPDHLDSDDDDDGIDDAFERSHGLDPLDGGDAVLDHDDDGFSNLDEFIAGTLPLDSDDFLHVLSIQAIPGFSVFFEAHSNRLYSLLYSDDLATGRWMPVPGQTDVFLPAGIHAWTDNTVTNNRVYRIDVKLP